MVCKSAMRRLRGSWVHMQVMALRAEVALLIAARETTGTEATVRIALQARSPCISPRHACMIMGMLRMHVRPFTLLPPSEGCRGAPDEVQFCLRMGLRTASPW